jgi:hypothetical protein
VWRDLLLDPVTLPSLDWLDRRNAAGWAEEWARVGPQWSGRSR